MSKIAKFVTSAASALIRGVDVRDVFFFTGLAMLGGGLYLRWGEWLALVVCGPLLSSLGLLMRGR